MAPQFLKQTAMAASIAALALTSGLAEASHFRGGAMIASVSASGLLTVNATTFWRTTAVADIDEGGAVQVSGVGSMTQQGSQVNDTSDSRFTKVTSVHTIQLSGSGLYTINASSCCRVSGIQNFAGGSSTSWQLTSQVRWNGSTAITPILFNFSNVQPEVLRNANYNDNLDALAGAPGLTLNYDQALNPVIGSQPPGYTLNAATGAMFISAANTATYADNPSNPGADYSFSGNIFATNAAGQLVGQVEYEWLFDAVNTAGNNAPSINDQIINALIGDNIVTTVTASDDGLPTPPGALTWTDIGLLGSLGTCDNAPVFNTATQAFSWNTTGCTAGTYIYQMQTSDGSLTDAGVLTINLAQRGTTVPEPATLSLVALSLFGLSAARRRKI